MLKSTRLVGIATFIWLTSPAYAGDSRHVDIKVLAKSKSDFVGAPVATHGCLVKHFHGSFLHPCGSRDWHELVLIQDPDNRVPAIFQRLGIGYSQEVQADFTGAMVEVEVARPKQHKHPFLRLGSVANAAPYEP